MAEAIVCEFGVGESTMVVEPSGALVCHPHSPRRDFVDVDYARPETPDTYVRLKEMLEPFLALVLGCLLAPLIGVLWCLVRITSRGPGIYSQVRMGKDGRLFTIYKLRTMRVDAESDTGAVWAKKNDPRVTVIGRFLRGYHLDELPQIMNIVLGDMGFVGPRPERPEIAVKLSEQVPRYFDRLAVKPGVTGMAQIHLPPDTCLESVAIKLGYDLKYIESANPWLDLRVVFATAIKAIPFVGKWSLTVAKDRTFCEQADRLSRSLVRSVRHDSSLEPFSTTGGVRLNAS